ncbi:MAG TPA: cytochrome ubiquinol oxidase subunit I, partial [Gemmatimonadaceae bacterium]|nr:cytochrome ubiquinol oxidase subunit I [Gemmatimonadaceae bacterium]
LERFHRAALAVALAIAMPAAIVQPISGDLSARFVARWQPVKLAAMEGQFDSEAGAALRIGGWPDVRREQTRFAIAIPRGLSVLAYHDPNAVVPGLRAFPREDWPPVPVVHVAFQFMVGLGTAMVLAALWAGIVAIRRKQLRFESTDRRLLLALVIVAPFGFLATEAGWFVTEVGRQPWIVFGVMRTGDAVTPMPGLIVPFLFVSLLYCGLGVVVLWLLWRQIVKTSGEFPSARYTAADRREAVP